MTFAKNGTLILIILLFTVRGAHASGCKQLLSFITQTHTKAGIDALLSIFNLARLEIIPNFTGLTMPEGNSADWTKPVTLFPNTFANLSAPDFSDPRWQNTTFVLAVAQACRTSAHLSNIEKTSIALRDARDQALAAKDQALSDYYQELLRKNQELWGHLKNIYFVQQLVKNDKFKPENIVIVDPAAVNAVQRDHNADFDPSATTTFAFVLKIDQGQTLYTARGFGGAASLSGGWGYAIMNSARFLRNEVATGIAQTGDHGSGLNTMEYFGKFRIAGVDEKPTIIIVSVTGGRVDFKAYRAYGDGEGGVVQFMFGWFNSGSYQLRNQTDGKTGILDKLCRPGSETTTVGKALGLIQTPLTNLTPLRITWSPPKLTDKDKERALLNVLQELAPAMNILINIGFQPTGPALKNIAKLQGEFYAKGTTAVRKQEILAELMNLTNMTLKDWAAGTSKKLGESAAAYDKSIAAARDALEDAKKKVAGDKSLATYLEYLDNQIELFATLLQR